MTLPELLARTPAHVLLGHGFDVTPEEVRGRLALAQMKNRRTQPTPPTRRTRERTS